MEILNKLKVSRRHALRGILSGVGVSLWLPVLDAMCNENGTAFAAGTALPTTFGIFYWGNGIHAADWTPKATGDGDAWSLMTNLSSFSKLKADMTLVTGLQMMDGVFKGHGWGVVYVEDFGCNVHLDDVRATDSGGTSQPWNLRSGGATGAQAVMSTARDGTACWGTG